MSLESKIDNPGNISSNFNSEFLLNKTKKRVGDQTLLFAVRALCDGF